tara:strand:- start:39928 stop:40164 length:237 start_codon:yes stop_codon:yes gene_type:complete
MTDKAVRTPAVGEKVTIGFTSNGNGKTVKGRIKRQDVIKAIYEDTRRTDKGVFVFSVQVNNGEQYEVVRVNEGWVALA